MRFEVKIEVEHDDKGHKHDNLSFIFTVDGKEYKESDLLDYNKANNLGYFMVIVNNHANSLLEKYEMDKH